MMNKLELTDEEISLVSKCMDIHRQALVRKLQRLDNQEMEREFTLGEIEACSSISRKARHIDDTRLRDAG